MHFLGYWCIRENVNREILVRDLSTAPIEPIIPAMTRFFLMGLLSFVTILLYEKYPCNKTYESFSENLPKSVHSFDSKV